jgi:NitT/TauT family transport system permease protein
MLANVFVPNRAVSRWGARTILAVHVLAALGVWTLATWVVLPRPAEVLMALTRLWSEQGLGRDLAASLELNLKALALATAISLALAYASVVPFFRPLAAATTKGRFLGLAGLTFVFTLTLGGGGALKLALLVFGISVFLVTSLRDVVASIPSASFDHAHTLRMGEWRVTWEVVVRGTAAQAADALRQNAAIGWMMLPMVEGLARADGGLGAVLLNQHKHFHLAEVFAVQLLILGVGLAQDALLSAARGWLFPYANLTTEGRRR